MGRIRATVFALAALFGWPALAAGGDPECCIVTGPIERVPRAAAVLFRELPLRGESTPEKSHRENPWMPVPENLPVPDLARPTFPRALEPSEGQFVSALASPAPSASFLALGDDGTAIPPDTHGAVGVSHLMTTLNSQIRIQDRTGTPLFERSLDSFWAPARPGVNAFDPRIFYDAAAGRWISVATADSSSATSSVLVGTSQTSDPTGLWYLYEIDADSDGTIWADYPNVGFNGTLLVVQVNMYENCGESSCTDGVDNDADGLVDEKPFVRSQILVFDKVSVYSGTTGTFTRINVTGFGSTQVPAVVHDAGAPMYLLQNWSGNSNGNGFLRLYTLSGARGAETLSPVSFVATTSTWDHQPPGGANFAPQLGSTQRIMANDSRIHSAVYRNDSIWAAQTVFYPPGGSPARSSIQWWELSPTGVVRQRGVIDDPTGASFTAFPSIAVNRNGDALIGYSRFSAGQYASANYSFRAATDPPNTVRADVLLKAGEAPYYRTSQTSTRNRWGDYSATTVDPTNDTDFWTIQEFASVPASGRDRWGTWWGKVSPDGSPAPSACTPGPQTLCLNNGRFQVQAIFSAPSLGLTNAPAQAVSLTPDTGFFWFFSASNVEIAIKVVDGRAFNNFFWVFYGALSDVEYTITVTDTATGAVKAYRNTAGRLASVADVLAFSGAAGGVSASPAPSSGAPQAANSDSRAVFGLLPASTPLVCQSDARTLCLNGARFQVRANFTAPSLGLTNAPAEVVVLTPDTGYFWFFSANNVEIVIKVVDGRAVNGRFWVFYGALSDVEYTISVTDTVTGAVRTYTNPRGSLASFADTNAF